MKIFKLLFLLVSHLFLSSCNVSTLSKKDRQDLSKFQVKITIENSKVETGLNKIKVLLTDGLNHIINNDIKILLNNTELKHVVEKKMLFNKNSYYKSTSTGRNESYYFEIILSDNSRHPLAFIQPSDKHHAAKFDMPNRIEQNEEFVLKWVDLKTPHQLEFTTETTLKHKVNRGRTLNNSKKNIIDTLYSSSGQYIIPRSLFNNGINNLENLTIKLNRKELGMINPLLIKNSTITYIHTIEKLVYIENRDALVVTY